MFFRMIKGTLLKQKSKMLMVAFTIALGASLTTAMLNVMLDVGDKVNQELKAYGANITVMPQGVSLLNSLYDMDSGQDDIDQYLREDDLGKIKTIFWAFNIVDFTPFIETDAKLDGKNDVTVTGTWFDHHLELPTGETLDTGIINLRSWWEIDGEWLNENENAAMVGREIAEQYNISVGDTLRLETKKAKKELVVKGIVNAGGDEDGKIFAKLDDVQELADKKGLVSKAEVSALTTPDNDLAIKAAKNPKALSISDYETWYCTAYVSSICYQIQEAIPYSVASPVRQVSDSEGAILEKTQLLMLLITILSLIASSLGISNLVTASVMERSNELGLLKAIGAKDSSVSILVLAEIMITAIIGGIAGYFAGFGFAQIIGHTVFDSAIDMKPVVIAVVSVLVIIVTLVGSIPAIRVILRLRPTEVLHGR